MQVYVLMQQCALDLQVRKQCPGERSLLIPSLFLTVCTSFAHVWLRYVQHLDKLEANRCIDAVFMSLPMFWGFQKHMICLIACMW